MRRPRAVLRSQAERYSPEKKQARSLPRDSAARTRASFWAWDKQKCGWLPMRGERQRRPSEKVNEHRDTRSLGLREDIEVSFELRFEIALVRRAGRMPALQHGLKTGTPRRSRGAVVNRDIVPQRYELSNIKIKGGRTVLPKILELKQFPIREDGWDGYYLTVRVSWMGWSWRGWPVELVAEGVTVSMVVPWGVTIWGVGEVAVPPPHPASASAANTTSRGTATVRPTCLLAKIERGFAFLIKETKKSKKNRSNGH